MARPSRYSPEFREQAVRRVVVGGEIMADTAREIGVNPETLRQWVKKYRGSHPQNEEPLTEAERSELVRLRRANRELQMERDFLKKAAAFFAKEQR